MTFAGLDKIHGRSVRPLTALHGGKEAFGSLDEHYQCHTTLPLGLELEILQPKGRSSNIVMQATREELQGIAGRVVVAILCC